MISQLWINVSPNSTAAGNPLKSINRTQARMLTWEVFNIYVDKQQKANFFHKNQREVLWKKKPKTLAHPSPPLLNEDTIDSGRWLIDQRLCWLTVNLRSRSISRPMQQYLKKQRGEVRYVWAWSRHRGAAEASLLHCVMVSASDWSHWFIAESQKDFLCAAG